MGDIAVATFDGDASFLHRFSEPFTRESALKIIRNLKCDAHQTNLTRSLRTIMNEFMVSRFSSLNPSNVDQRQLCFVVSDARIDDDNREQLGNLVGQFVAHNILPVLLIVDSNDASKDSVLKTKSVEFTNTGVTTRDYLDGFPFPLFTVIQKVESIPDVISETLRQWMELTQHRDEKCFF